MARVGERGPRGGQRGNTEKWRRKEEVPLSKGPSGVKKDDALTVGGSVGGANDVSRSAVAAEVVEVEEASATPAGPTATTHEPVANGTTPGAIDPPTEHSTSAEDDFGTRVRLVQQLKVMEQQVSQRRAGVSRRREEIQRLRADITNALHNEDRSLSEAGLARARASDHEEAMQHGRLELEQRVDECGKRVAAQRVREQEWHEELESMGQQQSSVAGEAYDLEREVERLRRTPEDQMKQVGRAQAKLKSIDTQRSEFRVQGERLVRQSSEHRAACDKALAATEQLRSQLQYTAPESSNVLLWQAASGVLLLLLVWFFAVGMKPGI